MVRDGVIDLWNSLSQSHPYKQYGHRCTTIIIIIISISKHYPEKQISKYSAINNVDICSFGTQQIFCIKVICYKKVKTLD